MVDKITNEVFQALPTKPPNPFLLFRLEQLPKHTNSKLTWEQKLSQISLAWDQLPQINKDDYKITWME